jgi:hypothetical protein
MKHFITILLLCVVVSLQAQKRPHEFKNRDQIRALKTAFITDALSLTPKEAEKFWPVYNIYDKSIMELHFKKMHELRQKIKDGGGVDALTEKDATALLKEFLDIEKNIISKKEALNKQLLKIVSAKKILKLYKAEDDFNRHLLQRLRGPRRGPNDNNNPDRPDKE